MRPQKDRSEAEKLFLREGKSLEEAAAAAGVCYQTAWRWSQQGNWMQRRRDERRAPAEATVAVLQRQRDLLIKEIGAAPVAKPAMIDALHKIDRAIEKSGEETNPIKIMLDAFYRFAKFVGARANDNDCKVIHDWVEKFMDDEKSKCEVEE